MRVFLVAGEASGDRLGAALMAGLRSLTDVEFIGVGGPLMQAEGMTSLFPMEELSVMGIVEVLPKYRHLKRRIAQTAEAALRARPDVMITIDSPDFCLRVARIVKERSDIRTVHYVAPSVWAWRPKRARKMARVIDHVLALLPFEPPYMEAAGMECDFVGHPVTTEPVADSAAQAAFRAAHGLGDAPVLLVLPGSRRGEVSRLAPIFGRALEPVLQAHPALRIVVPTTANVTDLVRALTADWPEAPLILSPEGQDGDAYRLDKSAAFATATAALAASGTVSLELAAAETPMVIAYDANLLSRTLVERMLLVDTVTLVNLVSETRDIPECTGARCKPDLIAGALLGVLAHPEAQRDAMRITMERLGRGGVPPGLRAAKAVLAGLERQASPKR